MHPKTWTRSYAATAHYVPNKDRPNFTVSYLSFDIPLVNWECDSRCWRKPSCHAFFSPILRVVAIWLLRASNSRVGARVTPSKPRMRSSLAQGIEWESLVWYVHWLGHYCSTIKSPQILELSGIGRKDVLSKIGVDVKIELPGVGENVQVYFEAHHKCKPSHLPPEKI